MPSVTVHRHVQPLLLPALILLGIAVMAAPTGATTANRYGSWTVSGSAGSYVGTLGLTTDGFPDAAIASSSRAMGVAGTATLTASSPFGTAFGSSSGAKYLTVGATPGDVSTTSTTITFDGVTPGSGWGFALGDVDAESVRISATDLNGAAVDVDGLGFAGTFNYASGGTDEPTWDPGSGTLVGNPCPAPPDPPDCDTAGASGWFRPGVPLHQLTLTFSVQSGTPQFQLWVAANTVTIPVRINTDVPAPPIEVTVSTTDGTPVASTISDDPEFDLPAVVAGPDYIVEVEPPPGWQVQGATKATVSTGGGALEPIDFQLVESTATTTTTTAPTTAPTAAPADPAPLRFTG